jgi:hypothetical protein
VKLFKIFLNNPASVSMKGKLAILS